MNRRWNAN